MNAQKHIFFTVDSPLVCVIYAKIVWAKEEFVYEKSSVGARCFKYNILAPTI